MTSRDVFKPYDCYRIRLQRDREKPSRRKQPDLPIQSFPARSTLTFLLIPLAFAFQLRLWKTVRTRCTSCGSRLTWVSRITRKGGSVGESLLIVFGRNEYRIKKTFPYVKPPMANRLWNSSHSSALKFQFLWILCYFLGTTLIFGHNLFVWVSLLSGDLVI